MPTDEERREVAENLRHLATDRHIQYKAQFFDELVGAVVGLDGFHGFEDLLERLADLIDPGDTTESFRDAIMAITDDRDALLAIADDLEEEGHLFGDPRPLSVCRRIREACGVTEGDE